MHAKILKAVCPTRRASSRWKLPLSGSRERVGVILRTGLVLAVGTILLTGCNQSRSHAPKPEPPKKPDQETRIPGQINGTGWHINWRTRNENDPNGPSVPVLMADAERGEMSPTQAVPTVRLYQVRAQMFREGKHSADIAAATIEANQRDRKVFGSGGVRVTSLTDPPDTIVTADAITWDTHTNTMVATGHAHLVQRATPKHPEFIHDGGRITFDTRLKQFDVE